MSMRSLDVGEPALVATPAEGDARTKLHTVYLKFETSSKSPDYMEMFMENGGPINAMAARWQSDMSVSGSEHSQVVIFHNRCTTSVKIEIPTSQYKQLENDQIELPSHMRLNAMTQRLCTSINGTIVHSLSGQSSAHLYDILRAGSHYQMGVTYKSFTALAAAIAVSRARIVSVDEDGKETRLKPVFKSMPKEMRDTLEYAVACSEEYAKAAYATRQILVYPKSPMLHKAVYNEAVGINGRGYSLLHSIMDRTAYVSLETLNGLYEAAIASECAQEKDDIQTFLSATDRPGMIAASEAKTVASATSLIVNVLMSYRADGRNVVMPAGVGFVPVENWNSSVPRSCLEAGDCDNLAMISIALIRSAQSLTESQLVDPKYKYLKAVHNVICPHYQLALSVIGATSAEGTTADANHSSIAGHAITVLIPTVQFLRGISKPMHKRIGANGTPVCDLHSIDLINEMRFKALYPKNVIGKLPENEKRNLENFETAQEEFTLLSVQAIEGTAPTDSRMWLKNSCRRKDAYNTVQREKVVFGKASPNVFRAVQVMHVGGRSPEAGHVFYSDLVELTFAPDNPLYTDKALREANEAATQFVLTPDTNSNEIKTAGCTPKQMVMEEYGVVPLVKLNTKSAEALDVAGKMAALDVIPHRTRGPTQLSKFQSETLRQSMDHIETLANLLAERTETNEIDKESHQCVAYIAAFNTLVHNPEGVKQFIKQMENIAICGIVDKRIIPGLAVDSDGKDVGVFIHLDIYASL